MFDSILITFVLYGIHVLSMLFVFMYVHCCPWRITSDDIRACRLKIEQQDPNYKTENSGALEWKAAPALLVTPVVLLLNDTHEYHPM
jgi:hypothetical protein